MPPIFRRAQRAVNRKRGWNQIVAAHGAASPLRMLRGELTSAGRAAAAAADNEGWCRPDSIIVV